MLYTATAWILASPKVGEALSGVNAPNPDPKEPPGLGPKVDLLLGWLKWIGIAAGVGGLIICGIMMMAGRRNRSHLSAEGAAGVPWILLGVSLVALSAGLINAIM